MIEFKLNPFTLELTNVHTLLIKPLDGPFESEDAEGNKIWLQKVYYKLVRTTDEDITKAAEEGNADIPAELSMLLLGQLTGTLTEEQKGAIGVFLQSFNENITVNYDDIP